jgi:hypothetical protein
MRWSFEVPLMDTVEDLRFAAYLSSDRQCTVQSALYKYDLYLTYQPPTVIFVSVRHSAIP